MPAKKDPSVSHQFDFPMVTNDPLISKIIKQFQQQLPFSLNNLSPLPLKAFLHLMMNSNGAELKCNNGFFSLLLNAYVVMLEFELCFKSCI